MSSRLLVLACLIVGCQDLPDVDRLRCGNGLIERSLDEDCDGLSPDSPYACGPVGSAAACRFVCDAAPCPDGWACGQDGVCRASAGRFELSDVLSVDGDALELGDFDGDGRVDLATHAQGQLRIAYGGSQGDFGDVQALNVPPLEVDFVPADLDEDGLDDVALLAPEGLVVLRGSTNRRPHPVWFPSLSTGEPPTLAASIRTSADAEEEVLLLYDGPTPRLALAHQALVDDAVTEALGTGSAPFRFVVAEPVAADAPDRIVLARPGSERAVVFSVECAPNRPCATRLSQVVDMPEAHSLAPGFPVPGDLDGDGAQDLAFVLGGPDGRAIAVAYQRDGRFAAPVVEPVFAPVAGCGECPMPFSAHQNLQLIADVVGDARPDLISGGGIFEVKGGEPIELVQRWRSERPVTRPLAIDVDGDGHLDVVARSGPDINLLLSDRERITRVVVDFGDRGAANDPAVGDFDGDGRADLAAVTATGDVVVAFGTADEPLGARTLIGRVDGPLPLLVPTRRRASADALLDRPDDLAVFWDGKGVIIHGDGSRMPYGPARLASLRGPSALAIGPFLGGGAQLLIASRAMPGVLPFFWADREPRANDAIGPIPVDGCTSLGGARLMSRTVDWDGDGFAELLQIEAVLGPAADPPRWTMHLAGIEDGLLRCGAVTEVLGSRPPSALLTTDLDADGTRDVVVLLSAETALNGRERLDEEDPRGELAVWFDPPGDGALVQHVLPIAATAAAVIDLGGERAVVVFGEGEAHRIRWTADGPALEAILGVPRDVRAARAADVDGDGAEDLVLKTTTGVFTYHQATCSAREALAGSCTRREVFE